MADTTIEQRRLAFLRLQHVQAARLRQFIAWLTNVSYTLGAVALGDLLFARPHHVAGEMIFGFASLITIWCAVMLAPLGEPR